MIDRIVVIIIVVVVVIVVIIVDMIIVAVLMFEIIRERIEDVVYDLELILPDLMIGGIDGLSDVEPALPSLVDNLFGECRHHLLLITLASLQRRELLP